MVAIRSPAHACLRASCHRLRNYFDNFRMRMSLDQRAERHHEIYIFIVIDVPYARAMAPFQDNWAGRIHGCAS